MKRKAMKIAIIGTLLYELAINLPLFFILGPGYIWQEYLYIAVVLWAVLIYYTIYASCMKYFKNKQYIFSKYPPQEVAREWKKEKRRMQIKVFKILAYVFGAAAPFYLLAYLDDSEYLKTNLLQPILFFIICIVSLILWKRLERQQNNS